MNFSEIKSTSILTLAIELLSETSIIKLQKNAKYSLQDTLTVLNHAFFVVKWRFKSVLQLSVEGIVKIFMIL